MARGSECQTMCCRFLKQRALDQDSTGSGAHSAMMRHVYMTPHTYVAATLNTLRLKQPSVGTGPTIAQATAFCIVTQERRPRSHLHSCVERQHLKLAASAPDVVQARCPAQPQACIRHFIDDEEAQHFCRAVDEILGSFRSMACTPRHARQLQHALVCRPDVRSCAMALVRCCGSSWIQSSAIP